MQGQGADVTYRTAETHSLALIALTTCLYGRLQLSLTTVQVPRQ